MINRFAKSFSVVGLSLGLLFFCAALTPSLLPRNPYAQGILAGSALAVGYFVGWLTIRFWRFLELPFLPKRIALVISMVSGLALVGLCFVTLRRMAVWQNSIRELMEMKSVDSGFPLSVLVATLVTVSLVFLISRGIIWLGSTISRTANRVLPRRISIALGASIVGLVVVSFIDGFVLKRALSAMDEVFSTLNSTLDEDISLPVWMTTDGEIELQWQEVGRSGQSFIANGPDKEEIEALTGRPAKQPVRVYVGYDAAETPEERAKIALSDLIKFGGFDRSVLVVATPTGTGWLDPSAVQPLAYVHQGDLSIVATQYSYLPSWLTLMIDPDRSRREARALFHEVYTYWATLDPETRPRFYLFGLSLGALGSEASTSILTLLSDPIQGAFWVGPPFASTIWPQIVNERNEGTPPWQPIFQDSAHVRFQSERGFRVSSDTPWDKLRIVYLQHASDPMSFFSPKLAFSAPQWLGKNRGPDISPYFSWFPLVTFLQVAFDVPMATSVPTGYGHNFSTAAYIDGWIAVTEPSDWTHDDTARLKAHFADFNASPI